jgi:hypothetical protein
MAVSFAEPNNRLEQIVYQELGRSFASTDNVGAPEITIAVSPVGRGVTRTTVPGFATPYEMDVTGSMTIVRDGKVVLTLTRKASASYTTTGQVIADNASSLEAAERASRALAETLRLSLLTAFASSPELR